MSAYACEPGKGSEPGVGWAVALEMARYHDIWVITRANNRPLSRPSWRGTRSPASALSTRISRLGRVSGSAAANAGCIFITIFGSLGFSASLAPSIETLSSI